MALQTQTVILPLAAGLQTKSDPRALQPPSLAIARDVQFDELGGIQPRAPFIEFPTGLTTIGSATDLRRLAVDGDELVLLTKDAYYSWSERDQLWFPKGTYLAPKITERQLMVRTEEQIRADRAELDGIIVLAWVSVEASPRAMIAAIDGVTGMVRLAPTSLGTGTTRPRLLALTTRILLTYQTLAGDLHARSVDPSNLAASVLPDFQLITAANFNLHYDVCRAVINPDEAIIAYRRDTTTSYGLIRVPEAVTGFAASTKARDCSGVIAIAASPVGRLCVAREIIAASDVEADLLFETTFNDDVVGVGLNSGPVTGLTQITACWRNAIIGGQRRCYVFWARDSVSGGDSWLNYIEGGGTPGTMELFVQDAGIVARAFDHDGHVYVWVGYGVQSLGVQQAAQVQNSYLLIAEDGSVVAKAVMSRGSGYSQIAGQLSTVQDLGDGRYVFCGEQRRRIPIGTGASDYAARVPVEIVVEFDSDEARRTAKLGDTLYVTGGQILGYDGEGIAEVGFHTFPPRLGTSVTVGSGSIEPGIYFYRATYRWENARGERDRSTTATIEDATIVTTGRVNLSLRGVGTTLKIGTSTTVKTGTRADIAIELWRTPKNPTVGAPLYLTTSVDSSDAAGNNAYLTNTPAGAVVGTDGLADADLISRETYPETGGVLENLPPPAATIIAATENRIMLAGVAGAPNQIWYSKLRSPGFVAAFHDALSVELVPGGGAITALAFLQETLVAFEERAIYALPGDGIDNLGGGQNYGPSRLLSSDVGAVGQEAVALTPRGLLFKSLKGWFVLPGWNPPEYIGAPVAEFDSDTVKAVNVLESQHQVRILTDQRMLVWDYLVNEWAEWPIADGAHAVIWRGQHLVISGDAILAQSDTPGGVQLDVETAWIKMADLAGYQRLRWLHVVGEYRSPHRLRIRVARDYQEGVYFDDKTWTVTPTVIGGPLQVRHGPSIQKCEAIKVRITALHATLDQAPEGEALKLTGLGLEIGVKRGLYKALPAAQKQ